MAFSDQIFIDSTQKVPYNPSQKLLWRGIERFDSVVCSRSPLAWPTAKRRQRR
ncbi:MAG: hypothetical protein F6K26_02740 [Moorea sp. SIO2I5]|nr:hypothetical protein [Moorena sp. SIO2I5]